MEKNIKVELTKKWWTDNQPRSLSDKGKLADALKTYETEKKKLDKVTGYDRAPAISDFLAVLNGIEMAAGKTASACKAGKHDGAKYVLTNSLLTAVSKVRQPLVKELAVYAAKEKEISKIQFAQVVKDKVLWRIWRQQAKENYMEENVDFLEEAKSPSEKLYLKYIPEGAKMQINISSKLRKAIVAAYEANNLQNAPWAEAYKQIVKLSAGQLGSSAVRKGFHKKVKASGWGL